MFQAWKPRIRCYPKRMDFTQCSERIRKFLLDPNPKKSSDSDTDSDPDTVVEWNFLSKIVDQTLERKKSYGFAIEKFFLWRTGSRTHVKAIRDTI
jgi:hypothetical protein